MIMIMIIMRVMMMIIKPPHKKYSSIGNYSGPGMKPKTLNFTASSRSTEQRMVLIWATSDSAHALFPGARELLRLMISLVAEFISLRKCTLSVL